MTDLEVAATATAKPTPYIHEVLAGCRESGRTVAVVSNNAEPAPSRTYLDRTRAERQHPPSRRPHQPRPRPAQAQPAPDRASRPRPGRRPRRDRPRRRLHHRHRRSPPRRNRQHRLRQQTRQIRAHDSGRSRSSHHQYGRPRPLAPSAGTSRMSQAEPGIGSMLRYASSQSDV